LTSRIIDHLVDKHKDFKTSFFYCREVDQRLPDSRFLAMFKSLIRQLLHHDRTKLPTVMERRSNCRGGAAILDNEATAKSVLDLFWDSSVKHFIVLDGLDELPAVMREQMLKHLHAAVHRSERYTLGCIRVLLVSRDLPDMRKFVELKGDIETYELNLTEVQKDIEAYLSNALQEMPYLDETDRNRARWLISERSNSE
jgi:hypothetical protein